MNYKFSIRSLAIIAGVCCFLCLLACGGEGTKEQGGSKTDKRYFRYNQASGISSLDPAFAKDQANIWAVNQLFNGLVQMDDELNILPAIAKSWTINSDGLTYTFVIRDDVHFHDHELFPDGKGTKVTAHDVEYSFKRLVDPLTASSGSWLFNDRIADKDPFVALNDSIFQMKLKEAFRPMLGILSMQYCSIVPERIVKNYGKEFRANPIGTGPFAFKKWDEGKVLVLTKNDNYFEKDAAGQSLPYMDGVSISFMENKRNAFLKFKDGELDMLSGIDASYKDEVLTGEGALHPDLSAAKQLLRSPYMNTEYLGFSMRGNLPKAYQDKRVRQAINHAFDREKMIRYLRNNIGKPAHSGFTPPGFPSFNEQLVPGFKFNLDKAKGLLKEAGYPDGKGLPTLKLETTSSYQDVCTFFQNQLKDIGVPIELEIHPPSFLRNKIAKGESAFFRGSWIGDYPDAETYLTVFYGGNPAPPNYTQFKNKRYDDFYAKALATNKDESRYQLYQEMERTLLAEAPIIPLFYDEVLRFTGKDVEGLGVNAFNLLSLKKVKFK